MRQIEIEPQILDIKKYKKRTAIESDSNNLIDYDCLVLVKNKPVILYKKLDVIDTKELLWAANTIKYPKDTRTGGLKTTSAIFGYMPRNVLRKDYCSVVAMANKYPQQHRIFCSYAAQVIKYYQEYFPDIYQKHINMSTEKIKPEWLITNTPFTSGIVNKNNPLKYHHDAGNFKNVLSNMIVLNNNIKGGHLICPEFDIKFACDNNTIVIFDGAEILHGVSPILKQNEYSYRYSIVYYTLNQMWKCDDINQELLRIRKLKKEREFKRIKQR